MTISWLQGQSGVLNADVEKDVCWVNDTTWFDAGALDDSEYGHRHHTEPPASVVDVNTWKTRYNRAILLSDLQIRPGKVIHFGSLFGPERVEVRSEGHQMLERYITDSFDIWGQDILATTYTAEDHIQTWIKFVNKTLSGSLGLHQQTSDGGFIKDASQNIELVTAWVREIIQMVKQT
ncbi:hypothetical protein BX616_009967 [Lobosporangium transversale]|nr:hypothetical protein BX616_009967 [Lobosporangium transversale]